LAVLVRLALHIRSGGRCQPSARGLAADPRRRRALGLHRVTDVTKATGRSFTRCQRFPGRDSWGRRKLTVCATSAAGFSRFALNPLLAESAVAVTTTEYHLISLMSSSFAWRPKSGIRGYCPGALEFSPSPRGFHPRQPEA